MKVYHIEFAKAGHGLSGGEKCMVEIIKYFKHRKIKNILLTTDNGKETYEKLGLVEDEYLEYIIIKSNYTELKYHMFISYLLRIPLFLKIKNKVIKTIEKDDILMCHSDFFPNTIASKILSKHFKKRPYFWFHMLSPNIFRGYEGQYTKRWNIPSIRVIHFKLNQYLFKIISKEGFIITVNPIYKSLFKNKSYRVLSYGTESLYIIKKYSGIRNKDPIKEESKKYDLAFMGRFHAQKGLFEIPKILKLIKEKKKDVKLLIIGGGDKSIEKKFFKLIEKEGLSENIEYAGFISSNEKFDYLRKSKVFIFPSYYESFGQVALEAMTNGLPVVAYNLPIFCVFEKGMIKVPVLDNKTFANKVLRLLEDSKYYRIKSNEAKKYASTFSWKKTGEEVYNLIIKNRKRGL